VTSKQALVWPTACSGCTNDNKFETKRLAYNGLSAGEVAWDETKGEIHCLKSDTKRKTCGSCMHFVLHFGDESRVKIS
jgi:hypothetical protein